MVDNSEKQNSETGHNGNFEGHNEIDPDERDFDILLDRSRRRITDVAAITGAGIEDYIDALFFAGATIRWTLLLHSGLEEKRLKKRTSRAGRDESAKACLDLVLQPLDARTRSLLAPHTDDVAKAIDYITDPEVGMRGVDTVPTINEFRIWVQDHPSEDEVKANLTGTVLVVGKRMRSRLTFLRKQTKLANANKRKEQHEKDVAFKKLQFEVDGFKKGLSQDEIDRQWELEKSKLSAENQLVAEQKIGRVFKVKSFDIDDDGQHIAVIAVEDLMSFVR
jgi:hypothetical protein